MADKVEQIKTKLNDFKKLVQDLNIEVSDWKFNVGSSEAGTSVEVSIKLLVPKK
jgi:hypothetical protein